DGGTEGSGHGAGVADRRSRHIAKARKGRKANWFGRATGFELPDWDPPAFRCSFAFSRYSVPALATIPSGPALRGNSQLRPPGTAGHRRHECAQSVRREVEGPAFFGALVGGHQDPDHFEAVLEGEQRLGLALEDPHEMAVLGFVAVRHC